MTVTDEELVAHLRQLVDDQEGGDAVVLVQRQLFNRVVGRLAAYASRKGGEGAEPAFWHNGSMQIISHAEKMAAEPGEEGQDNKRESRFDQPLYTHSPSADAEGLREALQAMLDFYGPPKEVAHLCEYNAGHPITLTRRALAAQSPSPLAEPPKT
jgi:hypothetical protein